MKDIRLQPIPFDQVTTRWIYLCIMGQGPCSVQIGLKYINTELLLVHLA